VLASPGAGSFYCLQCSALRMHADAWLFLLDSIFEICHTALPSPARPQLFTTMRRDGALRFLPRGAHHDRPGCSPRVPPAHLASTHRILAARLALAPLALVLAQAPAPALLAAVPPTLVLADAWPRALPAVAPNALVVADAPAAELLAPAPDALLLAEAPAPAHRAHAPDAPGRTDARAPALLAPLPPALLNALSFACMQMPGCSC